MLIANPHLIPSHPKPRRGGMLIANLSRNPVRGDTFIERRYYKISNNSRGIEQTQCRKITFNRIRYNEPL
jgi:hypothetical protein